MKESEIKLAIGIEDARMLVSVMRMISKENTGKRTKEWARRIRSEAEEKVREYEGDLQLELEEKVR